MGLDFGKDGAPPSIFQHSDEVDTGQGKERIGQGSVVVSLDGTADADTIQDGIDLLPPTGGEVFIKEGTYRLKNGKGIIIDKDNVTITGVGAATIIQIGVVPEDTTVYALTAFRQTGILIKNLVIDCNESEQSEFVGAGGINFEGCVGCTITETIIKNMYAVRTAPAIRIWKSVTTGSNNIITGNVIRDGQYSDGLLINSDKDVISNNQIFDIEGNGLYIAAGDDMIVSNNSITGSSLSNGIRLERAVGTNYRALIDGNIIENVNNDGITALNYEDSIISNNIIMNNGNWGIDIQAGCNRTIVMGNQIRGNSSGQVQDNGTNTHPNGASGTTNLAVDDLNIIA